MVFKNVAGFDAFRLMAGAMGSLGVLLDSSVRVTPRPKAECSLAFSEPWPAAQARLVALSRKPIPLSGAFHDGERLNLRLSGNERVADEAVATLGGDEARLDIWTGLRHQRLPFFAAPRLWALVPEGWGDRRVARRVAHGLGRRAAVVGSPTPRPKRSGPRPAQPAVTQLCSAARARVKQCSSPCRRP